LRDSGITFVGKKYYFCTLVARREVRVSRYHAKLQKRYLQAREVQCYLEAKKDRALLTIMAELEKK